MGPSNQPHHENHVLPPDYIETKRDIPILALDDDALHCVAENYIAELVEGAEDAYVFPPVPEDDEQPLV